MYNFAMAQTIQQRIDRAKEILLTARHAAMATVNAEGSPHNTPFRFLHDKELKHIYWGSHPDSKHSRNVMRTGQIFVVLYDLRKSGGLYIEADNVRVLQRHEPEMKRAIKIHNSEYKKVEGRPPIPVDYYCDDNKQSTQRLYCADIKRLWIPVSKRDSKDLIIRDSRYEIKAKDLV